MSGFTGIFHRDGAPASAEEIRAMQDTLAHRGPDDSGVWRKGPVAFGHCALWITPESLHETLPFFDDGLAITCDARIDNRTELIESLGCGAGGAASTDSALILAAYRKWGEDCPAKLIGDFAIAIWDERARKLFMARDAMGIKGVYFFASDKLFAFGSEIKAITAIPEVPRRLNELRVLDYLANIFDDRQITFYKDVFRLPAATTLIITKDRVRTIKYWSLDPARELKLTSDDEYTEAFRECFTEAVRCRMRSAYPIGCTVSGGLDSSSIACTVRQLRYASGQNDPMDTYSLIFPGLSKEDLRHIDERPFINSVLNTGGFRPHFILADQLSPLNDVERIHFHLDEAFFAGNTYLHWAMYKTAQDSGVRVFFDGLDGDTTISHGFEYLADLIVGFRWKTLYNEVGLIHRNLNMGRKRIIQDLCVAPLCPTWVYKVAYAFRGRLDDIRITSRLMSKEFRERLRLTERTNSLMVSKRSCLRNAREKHWEMLNFPLYAHAMELADKMSAAFGLEARYPFFDRRLIELCLALPAHQKLSNGWSRAILRRAMTGILPHDIQWRPKKADLSSNFYRKMLETDRKLLDNVVQGSPVLAPYIDFAAFADAYRRYISNPLRTHDESSQIFAAVNLAVWLEKARLTP